jgi:hypothetical protein
MLHEKSQAIVVADDQTAADAPAIADAYGTSARRVRQLRRQSTALVNELQLALWCGRKRDLPIARLLPVDDERDPSTAHAFADWLTAELIERGEIFEVEQVETFGALLIVLTPQDCGMEAA